MRRPLAIRILRSTGDPSGSPGGGVEDKQAGENAERLLRTVLYCLTAVESFASSLNGFFKSVDLAVPYNRQHGHGEETMQEVARVLSDSSDETILEGLKRSGAVPQPQIDHATSGYIMHVDCGHNGLLGEVELRQLSLHLSKR